MAAFFVIRSSEVWTSVEKRKKYPLFRRYPWAIRPAAQGALQLPRACKMSAGTANATAKIPKFSVGFAL